MKRRCISVVLAVMLMIPIFVNAERFAKGFSFTFPEFVEKYNSAPSLIYGEIVPLYFLNLGASEYRNLYYAEVKPLMEVIVLSEDTTDKVVNFVINLKNDDSASYSDQVTAGKNLTSIMRAATFAVGDGKFRDPMARIEEEFGFPNEKLFENNLMEYDDDGITYAFNFMNDTITFSIRLTDIYESEAEYLAYRETTLPSK